MKLTSVNPINGKAGFEIDCWSAKKLQATVDQVTGANPGWANSSLTSRIKIIRHCAQLLKDRRDEYARLITTEMGKVISESCAEIDKCIFTCLYYAENASGFLADEIIKTDASHSYVHYEPLGTILGIMPWNFPFWQVFRFAIPALITGNTAVLKHASNVPQSALAAEQVLHDAGMPQNVFRSLMIHSSQLEPLFAAPGIRGIALTGSEQTGRKVARQAGANLKKIVLELGGSDAFIVLADADIEHAVTTAVISRFFTSGQSCINAKRIILVPAIAEHFMSEFIRQVSAIITGDPTDPLTRVGPMARNDLREKLHDQVIRSIDAGAKAIIGCQSMDGEGFYYQPSILDQVTKGMPAWEEELFGPVAAIIHAEDEQDAIRIANDTNYGLAGCVWTRNTERGENVARQLQTGAVYINGLVKSDPRLPFGGIKNSGVGRELGRHGMLEFANAKTIWVA